MRKQIFTLILVIGTCLSSGAFANNFGAQETVLKNGIQIVVIPNHRAPVVTHMIWVKVGGADNPPSQSGMAHYFEHLMFKGTPTLGAGEYSKTIKTLGGNDNAFTGADFTAYFESVAVENLPKIMEMAADRFQNLAPPQDHFKSEKLVVLEERRQRTENDPRALFGEQIYTTLFTNHPYATPVIGWMDEIKNYEWVDVKTYYDTWYHPNNMIVVISGDITMDEFLPLAQKYYGVIPAKDLPERVRPSIPPSLGETLITLRHKQIQQASFYKIYVAPTEHKNRKDSLALQVLANILDDGPTTRLYQRLVIEQKKAIDVSFFYDANAVDYGTISIDVIPADGVEPKDIEPLINAEIDNIIQNGVTQTEVKDAIQRLQDQAIFARDSVAGPAMIFGQALSTGSTIQDVENWPNDIETVTAQDIQTVAKKYLDKNAPWVRPPVTGFLLPKNDAKKGDDHVEK